jgi:hypothetical protein
MSKNPLPVPYWIADGTNSTAITVKGSDARRAHRGCRSFFAVVQDMLGVRLRQFRVALGVDVWTCIECGIVHERDPNAAINLEKRGLATPEVTRRDKVPRHPGVSSAASAAAQPRTLTVRT